ncbi:MAG: RagB/SusD family nutrient uptake outer membrane protein [Prevotellaceae bacterium]|nr:RagB/SusD family nutrient uptake outer membrane protein [Prevotellaceae bacterium]
MRKYFNKPISLVLSGVLCLVLAGCGDFLEIEPKTFVSEDNFWNEKTDIDQMVAGVYVKMQADAFIQRCIMWGETRSDNIVEGLNASDQTNIYRTLKENLLSTNAYTTWVDFYAVINQCNTIIEMAPVVSEKDPVYTESDVLATQAEVKALRDLCYFYLVRAFKDVPYYTNAIQSEDDVEPIAPSDGDSIVGCLIVDLEDCVSNALKAYPKDSSNSYDSSKNRITQNAIYALLTDLCLWNGDYQKAVDYAQRVIDAKYDDYMEDNSNSTGVAGSGGSLTLFQHSNDTWSKGFPLYPCYSNSNTFGNAFDKIFGGTQNSEESIFELSFTYDGTSSNYLQNTALATLYGNYYSSGGNSGEGYLACNDEIVSELSSSTSGSVFDHRYDARYYENIKADDEYNSGYPNKYVATGATVETASSGSTLPFKMTPQTDIYANRNFIFYRLTDVMLMQAEALIELGSDNSMYDDNGILTSSSLDENLQRAFYIIWAVNRRSILTNSTTNTSSYELSINNYNTKSLLEDLVMKERRRELMFEGKRWFDLIRQCHRAGTTDYVRSHVGAKGSSGGSATLFTNYEALFWPYNKDEVKNNDLLSQKPYYGNDDDESSFSSTK